MKNRESELISSKRHKSEVNGLVCISNTLRKLSRPTSDYVKIPVNIGDLLKEKSGTKAWKDFKLYVKYLDLKVQNPDCGTFEISHSHRYYQRTIKALIKKGWASRKDRAIHLKAYQHVWRDMGINRVNDKGILRFKYWKIKVDKFSTERRIQEKGQPIKGYLVEIEHAIRKKITVRQLARMRFALKGNGMLMDTGNKATFSAKSAGSLFGYKSPDTGSKLRKKYFAVIPTDPELSKPRFNKVRGRFEEPTKQIVI